MMHTLNGINHQFLLISRGALSRHQRCAPALRAQLFEREVHKQVFCLGGPSGAGKSHQRKNSPVLRNFPCVDIADCYGAGAKNHVEAADMVFARAEDLLEQGHKQIVMEAFFSELQRERAKIWAAEAGVQIRWIWCHAPRKVCEERVLAAADLDGPERFGARLQIVRSIPEHYFLARPDESPSAEDLWQVADSEGLKRHDEKTRKKLKQNRNFRWGADQG
ncbi:hypothetical protein DUNSADRAFT_15605 [Dunaliella salina]|uniref:UDP-N-acetylglucosamine kinase n=1 Tax=Dunaliella salina TaxID=3046 RepID=A0ABQ7H1L2_DUNSA|nr:hypothetical protein DUNSADRAFT_15605 [Dunaliella salina]|eukprot:KAF5840747.1 hypothetical protein DUNSADRAFT_15605 [Dunaliella salina]